MNKPGKKRILCHVSPGSDIAVLKEACSVLGYQIDLIDPKVNSIFTLDHSSDLIVFELPEVRDRSEIDKHRCKILQGEHIPYMYFTGSLEKGISQTVESESPYGFIERGASVTTVINQLKAAFKIFNLEKSENLLKMNCSSLLKAIKYPVLVIDRGGVCRELFNEEGYTTPLTKERMLGACITDFFEPVNSDSLDEIILNCFSTGDSKTTEVYTCINSDLYYYEVLFSGYQGESILMTIRDITAIKQASQELRLKSLMMDQISDCVTITDLEGRITYINQAETALFKKNKDELLGKKTDIYGDDKTKGATQKEIIEKTLKDGSWCGEVINFSETGEEHVMYCRTMTIKDEGGSPVALCGISTDITNRKLIEQRLLQSEEKYRLLFDCNADSLSILRIDANGMPSKFLEVNEAAAALIGYTRDELLAKSVAELEIDFNQIALNDRIEELQSKGKTNFETTVLSKDGGEKTLDVKVVVISYDGGPALMNISRDITERKRMEEELKLSVKRFEEISEHSRSFLWLVDPALTYTSVTSSVKRVLGYSPEEMVGKRLRDFHPEDQRGLFEAFCREKQDALDSTVDYENPIIAKNGTTVWVTTAAMPVFDEKGNHLGFQGIDTDITARKMAEIERKKVQEQLAQAQKLDSIGRLAGGVAHDFNNTLSIILGYAESALPLMAKDNPLNHSIHGIQLAAAKSAKLTRQLLAFARKQTYSPIVMNINNNIKETMLMLRRIVGVDIHIELDLANDLWLVNFDPCQIDQILTNLSVNARDAITGNGTITIKTSNAIITEGSIEYKRNSLLGEYVILSFKDNGCGIDESVLPKIFEPFYTTKSVGEGTGLGLANVFGIIKQNKGHIFVESSSGTGAEFKIYLPRVQAELTSMGEEAQSYERKDLVGTETILVVEDEEGILDVMESMLINYGYRVLTADNPEKAICTFQECKERIDLLITDVMMPGMNGVELAYKLQEIRPELPVLFMSGFSDGILAKKGNRGGATNFINKPFSYRELVLTVRGILNKEPK